MEAMTIVALTGVILVASIIWVVRSSFKTGELHGIREAMDQLVKGVSCHYEVEGERLPEQVSDAIDELNRFVGKASSHSEKLHAYHECLWSLGDAMGKAAWSKGFESGHRFMDTRDGEVRVDLTEKELVQLSWLAHYGFENMVPNFSGNHHFSDREDAFAAASAVERLERAVPKKYRDPDEPFALASNRQQMIWGRWPSKS